MYAPGDDVNELWAKIEILETSVGELEFELGLVETERDNNEFDRDQADREANRLGDLIDDAVDSLRLLAEVPLKDLEDSILEIVKGLQA